MAFVMPRTPKQEVWCQGNFVTVNLSPSKGAVMSAHGVYFKGHFEETKSIYSNALAKLKKK